MTEAREAKLDFSNPLLINEIAERVLQLIPVAELKSCRLVCSLWWKESLDRWRRTYWLQLSSYDRYSGRIDEPNQREFEERMAKCLYVGVYISFLDDPLDSYKLQTQPFQKLKLFKSRLAFDSGKNEKLEGFLTKSGPSVKYLALEKCTIDTAEDFRQIIFRFAPNLEYLSLSDILYKKLKVSPKNELNNLNLEALIEKESDVQTHLKYLQLGMCRFDTISDRYGPLPLTWTQFFAHFPKIQNLEFLTLFEVSNKADINSILESIHALRTQCGILQQIRGLDLLNLEKLTMIRFDRGLSNLLRDISLPLTFFAYDSGYEHDCEINQKLQLEIAASTLETLVIYKGPFSAPFGKFPYGNRFPNLVKLTLVGPIVHFLEHMPSLKIVRLFHKSFYEHEEAAIRTPKVIQQLEIFFKNSTYYEQAMEDDEDEVSVPVVPVIGNTDFSQMAHLTFPNIVEFQVEEVSCTAFHVEQLARLMPNVKRLRIGLKNESFRAVCEHWKELEALDIYPVHVDEEGITGLVPGEETRLPNITDLKYLRAFGMSIGARKTYTEASFSDLTDSSMEHGLLNYLERVLMRCSPQKMSEENYKKLKSMFPPYPYSDIRRIRLLC